jgi:hypothetical protein
MCRPILFDFWGVGIAWSSRGSLNLGQELVQQLAIRYKELPERHNAGAVDTPQIHLKINCIVGDRRFRKPKLSGEVIANAKEWIELIFPQSECRQDSDVGSSSGFISGWRVEIDVEVLSLGAPQMTKGYTRSEARKSGMPSN